MSTSSSDRSSQSKPVAPAVPASLSTQIKDSQLLPSKPVAPAEPVTDAQIADLRQKYGVTSNGRGIKEFTQIIDFARAVLALRQPAPNTADDARDAALMVDTKLCELLPGPYYMDPPDGGDVTPFEQCRRMAKDAARYRWLRSELSLGEWNRLGHYGDTELDAQIDAATQPPTTEEAGKCDRFGG